MASICHGLDEKDTPLESALGIFPEQESISTRQLNESYFPRRSHSLN